MADLIIDAQGLRKVFGSKLAVADLTLQVQRGEVFGFLGPNGAGKTTSIKMLLSLISPTSGTAMLLGRPLGDRTARARIGFLPEHFRFHEWLEAGEFLHFHGRLYGMRSEQLEEAVPRLLGLVGLSERSKTKLGTFSKGMLQRIGLAQSLLNDPELVFLDEPTSGLDPIGRRLVRDIINELRSKGTTVFLNSHLLSEVERSCDRVAFIRSGRILQVSHLKEFDQEPFHVALRVGRVTRELLEGLAQFGEGAQLDGADGRISLRVGNEENLPRLAQWLHDNDVALYELSPSRMSLEERFLRVVGEESNE